MEDKSENRTPGKKQKLLILLGPTACGKTALSIGLAQRFSGEIISGDSMQVYRGMDIGTAKIMPGEMQSVPHHLLDILDPSQAFSVADFRSLAEKKIREIAFRGKLPMVVGGTGLYIDSLLYPYNFAQDMEGDPTLRQSLQEEYLRLGGEAMHQRLAAQDPEAALRIHPNDAHRLVRALEVLALTGETISQRQQDRSRVQAYDAILVGLTMEREQLYRRIEQRVDLMFEAGLLAEVENLLAQGISPDANSMQGIGYRQTVGYLQGEYSLEEAKELIKRDTRRFAKRQQTWFKRNQDICWFDKGHYRGEGELLESVGAYVAEKLKES